MHHLKHIIRQNKKTSEANATAKFFYRRSKAIKKMENFLVNQFITEKSNNEKSILELLFNITKNDKYLIKRIDISDEAFFDIYYRDLEYIITSMYRIISCRLNIQKREKDKKSYFNFSNQHAQLSRYYN